MVFLQGVRSHSDGRDLFALAYDPATNRITTAGFSYDAAGNQVRALVAGGASQRFQYDAANRLVKVKADDNQTVIASYTYGDSNERLVAQEGSLRTYYACGGKAEYVESGGSTTPQWSKTYIYLGARLLSTLTPNGSGGEAIQYHHPDRLGTRLVTNAQDTSSFEQVSLPFGTALNAESSGSTNRRFTSYDRSVNTGLDYAVNRHYDPQQGRFTQVDPIGMSSVSLSSPQTLNLYAYCINDPVNHTDPSGLGFISFLKKVVKWAMVALAVALIVVAIINIGNPLVSAAMIKAAFAIAGLLLGAALGPSWLKRTITIAGAAVGIYLQKPAGIWNIANPRNGSGAGGIGALLSALGAINLFISGNSDHENAHSKGRCPPTGEQLANNPIVKRGLNEALRRGIERRLEHGGWVFWNKSTGRLFTIIKEPTVDPLNTSGVADRWDRVYLTNPPTPAAGWSIIATFHTHLENVGSHSFDIAVNNSRRVPGLIITPNGTIEPYGDFKRGIWLKDLPNDCK